jgi:hypothetical protein
MIADLPDTTCSRSAGDKKMPVLCKVLLPRCGRICKAAVCWRPSIWSVSTRFPSLSSDHIVAGLPGLVLQWAHIPLILFRTGKRTAGND